MRKPIILLAVTLLVGATSLGCVRLHGPENLRRDLAGAAGVKLDREMGVTVTRSGVWLARKIMRWAGEEEIPLRGVRKVQVGIYSVEGLRRGVDEPGAIRPDLLPGWMTLARVRKDGEQVLVMTREGKRGIDRLVAIVAEEDQWVVVRLHGRLDSVLEQALEYAFDEIDRPDLHERVRDERVAVQTPKVTPIPT